MTAYSASKILRTIRLIHYGLIAGPCILAIAAIALISSWGGPSLYDTDNLLTFIPICMLVIVIPTSDFIFTNLLRTMLNSALTLDKKLKVYMTAYIIKMTMLESVTIFSVAVCILTNSLINLLTFAIALVLMLRSGPSTFKITESLGLSHEEKDKLMF